MKTVFFKSPLCANTGYGHDGFDLTKAMHLQGLDVRLLPTSVVPPVPMGVAQMLVKGLDVTPDFFIHHVDPQQIGLSEGERKLPAKKIAWTMWEFTTLTPEIAETMTQRLEGYDLLLCYDEVSWEALKPHADEAGVEVRIMQGCYDSEKYKFDRERDWTGTFRFCMVGQLHLRKNPFAAIEAMERVVEEFPDTELHLKTTVRFLHPALMEHRPWLKIHYELWSEAQLREFYGQCHTYVAPSWGEGKNLPALEAQTTGIPVIYSDFGGHRQWGSSDFGWPVGGPLVPHEGMLHIDVDVDQLAEAMIDARRDPAATRMKGEKASRLIPAMCDWQNVVRRLVETI